MKELGQFDANLQMFVDPPKEVDMNKLRFHRWRAEKGQFSHLPFSGPRGEYLFRLSDEEIRRYVIKEKDRQLAPVISQYEQQH